MKMTIGFNRIPSNIVAPLVAFEVTSAGNFENQSRLLLVGHAAAAGEATLDEPVICTSLREAARLCGGGSMLHEMFRLAIMNAPAQEIWLLPATETGTAQTRTLTLADIPAAGGVGLIDIDGKRLAITIAAGATAAQVAAALNTAINGFYEADTGAYLPFTSAVADEVVTLTARHKGAYATALDINVPAVADNALTGCVTAAVGTAGAGTPDLSNAFAALGDDAFDWIVSAFDDATSIAKYKALMSDASGRWAFNKQIYGHVFFPKKDSIANLTTFGLSHDDRHITAIPIPASGVPQAGYSWAAAMVARVVPWLADGALGNVSRNQTGLVVGGLQAPRSRADWWDYTTRNALLISGISTFAVDTVGRITIDKIVTMQRTTSGVPDTTFRDIQMIGQIMYSLRYFRQRFTIEHMQKGLGQDNPRNLLAITTIPEIKATVVHAYTELERNGVLVNVNRAAELLQVEQDSVNANRVNIGLNLDMADPLDIIATNAFIWKQFRRAA